MTEIHNTVPIKNDRKRSMAFALFFHAIEESHLLNEQQIDELLGRFAPHDDLDGAVAFLRDRNLLTPYQIERMLKNQGKGLMLGQYRIVDELGRGGFGQVYKAVHGLMKREVAIKVIAPDLTANSEARQLFLREVQAATRLIHSNIVLAFDADDIDGSLFFAMELVPGPTLDDLVENHGPLSISLAWAILYQTAQALQFAHEKGMVHRDIKPSNLMLPGLLHDGTPVMPLNRPGLVKVVDFGLARLSASTGASAYTIQKESGSMGTPAFISPEQARNIHQVDIRSDHYSLGCSFYFALAGVLPFEGESPLETVRMHFECDPEPISRFRPDLPQGFAAIIRKLMMKAPEQRFQTPADLIEALSYLSECVPQDLVETPLPLPRRPNYDRSLPPVLAPKIKESSNKKIIVPTITVPTQNIRSDSTKATDPVPKRSAPIDTPAKVQPEPTTASVEATTKAPSSPGAAPPNIVAGWQDWLGVVHAMIQGSPLRFNDTEYRALYKRLMDELRIWGAYDSLAPTETLRTVIEPWINLASLRGLDRRTQAELLHNGERLEQLLIPPKKSSSSAVVIAAIVTAAALGIFLLFGRYLLQSF